MKDEPSALWARRGAGSAAIDTGFVAILDCVITRGCNAITAFAHAALAIVGHGAREIGIAGSAIRTTAIDARFFSVQHAVRASGNRAHTAATNATGALRTNRAGFSVRTRQTRATAIDIAFASVFHAVGAFRTDALIHLANEIARAALDTVDTRDARTTTIANALRTSRCNAERSLNDRIMGQYRVRANVGRAILGIVVGIVCGDLADIKRDVALPFDAIAIKLRRQWCSRGLQAFSKAFATLARGFAAEIHGAVILAIGGGHALGRRLTTAARSATTTSASSLTARPCSPAAR